MSFSNGDVKLYHSGTGGPDLFRDSNLGGAISGVAVVHNRKYNFCPDISRPILGTDPSQGNWAIYWCGFVRNMSDFAILNNFKIWISQQIAVSDIDVAISKDTNGLNVNAKTIANKLTAPSGQTFVLAETEATALNIGTLLPADYQGIWFKVTSKKGTPQLKGANFTIRFTFDKPAEQPESGGGTAGFDIVYLVATREGDINLNNTTKFAGQLISTSSSLIGIKPAKILMQLKKFGSPTGVGRFKVKHQNSSTSHPDIIVWSDTVDVTALPTANFTEVTAEDPLVARALASGDIFGFEYLNGDASNYVICGYVDVAESIPNSWLYTINSTGTGTANTARELWAALYKTGVGTGGGGTGGGDPGDTTPPTIVTKDPTPNATNVALNKTISIVFSEAMATSTITDTTVNLKQGATPISCALTVNPDLKTVTLNPDVDLSYSTVYTVTVTNGVQDQAGNPLAATESWTFTTVAAALTTLYDHLAHASSWQAVGSDTHIGRGLRQISTSTSGDSLYHDVPKEITAKLRREGTVPSTNVYCRVRNFSDPNTVLATIGQVAANTITTDSAGVNYTFTKTPASTYSIEEDDCILIEYHEGDSNNFIEAQQDGSADWSSGNEVNMEDSFQINNVSSRDAAWTVKG